MSKHPVDRLLSIPGAAAKRFKEFAMNKATPEEKAQFIAEMKAEALGISEGEDRARKEEEFEATMADLMAMYSDEDGDDEKDEEDPLRDSDSESDAAGGSTTKEPEAEERERSEVPPEPPSPKVAKKPIIVVDPDLADTSVHAQLKSLHSSTESVVERELRETATTPLKVIPEEREPERGEGAQRAEEEEEEYDIQAQITGMYVILQNMFKIQQGMAREMASLGAKVDRLMGPADLLPRLVTECGSLGKQLRAVELKMEKQTSSLAKMGQNLAEQMTQVIRTTAFRPDPATQGYMAYTQPLPSTSAGPPAEGPASKPEENAPALLPKTAPSNPGRIVPMRRSELSERLLVVAKKSNTMPLFPIVLSRLSKLPAEEAREQLTVYETTGTLQKKKN